MDKDNQLRMQVKVDSLVHKSLRSKNVPSDCIAIIISYNRLPAAQEAAERWLSVKYIPATGCRDCGNFDSHVKYWDHHKRNWTISCYAEFIYCSKAVAEWHVCAMVLTCIFCRLGKCQHDDSVSLSDAEDDYYGRRFNKQGICSTCRNIVGSQSREMQLNKI